MERIRVEYTITLKVEDGRELTFNKEKTLAREGVHDKQQIQDYLEREFRETEQADFLIAIKSQIRKEITGTTLKVNKVSELIPTGDDDQM